MQILKTFSAVLATGFAHLAATAPLVSDDPAASQSPIVLSNDYVNIWHAAAKAYEDMKSDEVGLSPFYEEKYQKILGLTSDDNPMSQDFENILTDVPNRLQGPLRALVFRTNAFSNSTAGSELGLGSWHVNQVDEPSDEPTKTVLRWMEQAKKDRDQQRQDHEQAEQDHRDHEKWEDQQKADHDRAEQDHRDHEKWEDQQKADHDRAEQDHRDHEKWEDQQKADHDRAEEDHNRAANDHKLVVEDLKQSERYRAQDQKVLDLLETLQREHWELSRIQGSRCGLAELTESSWSSYHGHKALIHEWYTWREQGMPRGHFVEWLFETYAPGLSKADGICNGRGECSIGHCRNLDLLNIPPWKRDALFYIFEGIAKANREIFEEHAAIAEAVDVNMADINHIFVDHTPKIIHERRANRGTGAAETPFLNMIFGNLVLIVCDVAAPGAGALYGVGKDAFINMNDRTVKEKQAAIMDNLGLSTPIGSIMIPLEQFSTNLRENFEVVRDKLHDRAERTFRAADPDDFLLAKLLEDGSWISRNLDNEHFRARRETLKLRWEASSVNLAWRSNYVIFTQSVAKEDDCKKDDRGHPSIRLCRESSPGFVHYAYYMNWEKGQGGKDWFEAPPGFSKLRHGLNMTDMLEASLLYYQRFGFDDFMDIDPEELAEFSKACRLCGVVNIPIWNCPDGHCITRMGHRKGLNVPCLSGNFQWDEADYKEAIDNGEDETWLAAKAAGLMNHPSWPHECMNRHKTHCEMIDQIDPGRDWIWEPDDNKYIKASDWTLKNNEDQWTRRHHLGIHTGDNRRLHDMIDNRNMHIPKWRHCRRWEKHAWGVIEEVDGAVDTPRWRNWMDGEGKKVRGFDDRYLHIDKKLSDSAWGLKAFVEPEGVFSNNGTRIYTDMMEFMDDHPEYIQDMDFKWSLWRTSAQDRGFMVGDEDDDDEDDDNDVDIVPEDRAPESDSGTPVMQGPSTVELELPTAAISIIDLPVPS